MDNSFNAQLGQMIVFQQQVQVTLLQTLNVQLSQIQQTINLVSQSQQTVNLIMQRQQPSTGTAQPRRSSTQKADEIQILQMPNVNLNGKRKNTDEQDDLVWEQELEADADGKFECPVCHKKFMTRSYVLGGHRQLHILNPFSCRVCFKPFKDENACLLHENGCGIKPKRKSTAKPKKPEDPLPSSSFLTVEKVATPLSAPKLKTEGDLPSDDIYEVTPEPLIDLSQNVSET